MKTTITLSASHAANGFTAEELAQALTACHAALRKHGYVVMEDTTPAIDALKRGLWFQGLLKGNVIAYRKTNMLSMLEPEDCIALTIRSITVRFDMLSSVDTL